MRVGNVPVRIVELCPTRWSMQGNHNNPEQQPLAPPQWHKSVEVINFVYTYFKGGGTGQKQILQKRW